MCVTTIVLTASYAFRVSVVHNKIQTNDVLPMPYKSCKTEVMHTLPLLTVNIALLAL